MVLATRETRQFGAQYRSYQNDPDPHQIARTFPILTWFRNSWATKTSLFVDPLILSTRFYWPLAWTFIHLTVVFGSIQVYSHLFCASFSIKMDCKIDLWFFLFSKQTIRNRCKQVLTFVLRFQNNFFIQMNPHANAIYYFPISIKTKYLNWFSVPIQLFFFL